MWTVIGQDWMCDAQAVTRLVTRKIRNGGIVYLLDGRDTRINPDFTATLESVKLIIPMLKRQGYSFETVSTLLVP